METHNCQNCKKDFIIEPDDFSFYEKMKVPAPTWCPDCRMVRRMMWRNERSLYHRDCAATGKKVISCFPLESGITVYERDYWWSDEWDVLEFGKDYDFSRSFFEQYSELIHTVPLPNLFNGRCTNSSFSNHVGEMKNSYLTFAAWISEDIMYSAKVGDSRELVDCLSSVHVNLSYESMNVNHSSRLFFCKNCEACIDSWFLYDCSGCTNCFGCTNLRNKSYCIFNKQYTKEEYKEKIESFNLSSLESLNNLKKEIFEFWKKSIHRFAFLKKTFNCTGDNLLAMNNCKNCFGCYDNISDCKYCINAVGKMTDTYDGYGPGLGELMYEVVDSGDRAQCLMGTIVTWNCVRASYTYNCHGSSDIFGCVGLRDKKYCIFNKQYTKEEYEILVENIKKHMVDMPYIDSMGRKFSYGDFLPYDFSPFCYNETIAHEYFPLTKEEVLKNNFKWKNPEDKKHQVTIDSKDIPDKIPENSETILLETFGCMNNGDTKTKCTFAFKITEEELSFYKRFNLPLPQYCPNCRFYNRMSKTNLPKLWHRSCMCTHETHDHTGTCPNEFETSYAPDRPEIVYCEKCYQKEVI